MDYEYCPVTHKRCYGQKDANNVIAHARNAKNKKQTPQRSYYCRHCGSYHLTHFRRFKKLGEKSTKPWYKKAKENYKNHIGEEE